MSTQDAGTQAADKAASGPIEPDEAERLASMIRPAWEIELDDAQLAAIGGGPKLESAAAKLAEGGVDIGTPSSNPLTPPRDTVIDGMPTRSVGDGAAPPQATNGAFLAAIAEGVAIVDRGASAAGSAPSGAPVEAPRRAGPTKLGLGEGAAAVIAAANAAPAHSPSVESEPSAPPPQGKADLRGTIRMDSVPVAPDRAAQRPEADAADFDSRATAMHPRSTPPPATHAPAMDENDRMGAAFSRADDPIEIPVKKGPTAVLVFIGLTAVAAGIVAGVLLLGGDDKPKGKERSSSKTTTTEPADVIRAPAIPAETAAATAVSTETATATATASATATADASSSASVAASAPPEPPPTVAAPPPPPPKTAEPPPPKAPPPPPAKTSKPPPKDPPKPPPPKGTGGIIRDTPF